MVNHPILVIYPQFSFSCCIHFSRTMVNHPILVIYPQFCFVHIFSFNQHRQIKQKTVSYAEKRAPRNHKTVIFQYVKHAILNFPGQRRILQLVSYKYTRLFFLISSKEWKGKTKLYGAASWKKMCAKDIHPWPSHHGVYEIARFVDSRK